MNTSPRHLRRQIRLRAAALAIAATGTLATLATALVPTTDLDPAQPFAELLGQWCTVVLLGCAVWAWLVTVAVLLEAVRTAAGDPAAAGPLSARRFGAPAAYRRLVLSACGLALAAGVVSPALATPGPVHLVPPPVATVHPVDPVIDEPRTRPQAGEIVVRSGDSLWHLAAERLPEDADNATISHTWHRLYAANSDVIGADPDHLEPGQRLARPRAW